MPELTFVTRWPDGRRLSSYSPSLVVHDYLTDGQAYDVDDFVARTAAALGIASDRVEAKLGYPCSRAAASLATIRTVAASYPDGHVIVESLSPPAGGRGDPAS